MTTAPRKTYSVKEMFLTLQGEGAQAGRCAVFLRFAGCNLWNGLEKDRALAVCKFCDTDFVGTDGQGGGKFRSAEALADAVNALWPQGKGDKWTVITGGEPMLQVDDSLIDALHARSFKIAIETNGTLPVPSSIDWICVSPKADAELVQRTGDELKLVYPQVENRPEDFAALAFEHFFLQPCDDANQANNTAQAIRYCLANPRWRLSTQTHKIHGID